MSFVCPKKLSYGDTIALVAPSEPVEREDVEKIKGYLGGLGYKLKLGKHLFYKIGDYTAGTIEDRAEDLNVAFADPEVKAIFVGVGGYAADQVLELLNFETIAKNPKIFVGYSDATTLQQAFLAKTGLVTFHGPNAATLIGAPEYTLTNFWKVLSGETVEKIEPFSTWEILRSGKGKGILVGGNLDCMSSLLGTRYDPFAVLKEEKLVLFLEEDRREITDTIRDLFQLKHAEVLDRCEGMLVGKITGTLPDVDDYIGVPELKYVLLSLARAYDFPILWGVDFGHMPEKITIPIGVEGEIDTRTKTFRFNNCLT